MTTCPACGTENLPQARFCMQCGSPLQAGPAPSPPPSAERRVVTILFVDLVGFTERSDHADPEDVRRTLVPFHARVKEDLEGFGGTLDKFIGDAVLGVFGAPVAHEDDPARAVHAALRILQGIEDLRRTTDPDIAVRIAVNTGEAVVSFGTGPQVGEAVAGDVVNTASRMQGLAPRDSVVIGEATLRAVRDVFDVEALPPARVKGKTEPITVWRVRGERGPITVPAALVPFVGRDRELSTLQAVFDGIATSSQAGFVLLVGEPGIGKSRLVEELRVRLGDRAGWLAGRCVPYGEAVTFAPVAATVREIAAIGPGSTPREAERKLAALAASVEAEPAERDWLVSRLRPVLGIGPAEQGEDASTIPAGELASAWARVVGSASTGRRPRPLVLHLEDLHWAEPVLLEVVEGLARDVAGLPILTLCSTRPDLLEHHPGWAAEGPGAVTVRLDRLSGGESERLVDELLARAVLPPRLKRSLVERAGGNPLYALEFARMLGERKPGDEEAMALPDSVQAVIAARLDAIPGDLRSMVQDAAVAGTSFWPGILAELGDRPAAQVRTGLEALIRRGLVRRAEESAFDTEPEYGFTHALVGEVAYGRIPRARRARGHLAAGRWIERASGDRTDERAETLARHFSAAVELAEVAAEPELAAEAAGPAVRYLMAAGDRAVRLDAGTAFALYDRAVRMARAEDGQRGEALALSARMGRRCGRLEAPEVLRRYEESLALYRRLGDGAGEGRALIRVGSQLGAMGESARSAGALAEAVAVLETGPAGPELARAYAYRAEERMFAGDVRSSKEFADRALELLEGGAHDEVVIMALHIRGDARCSLGDLDGVADLEEALRLSESTGTAADIVTSQDYVGEWLWAIEGPRRGLRHVERALEVAERRGVVDQALWTKAGALEMLADLGEWDRAVEWSGELLALGPERVDGALLAVARIVRSGIAARRGRFDEAGSPQDMLSLAPALEEMQVRAPALAAAAELAVAGGDEDLARRCLEEFELVTRGVASQYREARLAPVARACAAVGEVALIEKMIAGSQGLVRRDRLNVASALATLAEARGDAEQAAALYADAAEGWRAFGVPFEEAMALLGRSRCLAATGSATPAPGVDADERRARDLLERLGASS